MKIAINKVKAIQSLSADINHSTPTNSGWTGLLQILDLKENPHLRMQLDSLSICQTQEPAVIQHSVHVLDPEGVHWAVEHHPVTGV